MRGKDRLALILAVAAAWSVSCSTPPAAQAPATSARVVATASPKPTTAVTKVDACIGAAPPTWTAGFQAQSVLLPSGMRFGLGAPTLGGQMAFGQFDTGTESGIGSLDLGTGRFSRIVTWNAQTGGMGWMAVELPWVVWEQSNSQTNLSDWSLVAWNRDTGARSTIATSRLADGSFLFGQPPLPAIRKGVVTWAQPLPKRGDVNESEIHIRDLASGRDVVVASGRVGAPVFAGGDLVWARRDPDGAYSFQATDATTLRAAELPDALREPGPILYVAGSAHLIAWSGDSSQSVRVLDLDTRQLVEYRAPDLSHSFQFLQLAGHYLLYYGGASSTVLDLGTGVGFDVAGSLAGSEERIVKEEPAGAIAQKGQVTSSRISGISLAAASTISPSAH